MGKSEDNKLMKRNALLNAAYELFTGKGVNKTSVSDIVERSGIAKGTFYLYFLDKYDLRNKLDVYKRQLQRELRRKSLPSPQRIFMKLSRQSHIRERI